MYKGLSKWETKHGESYIIFKKKINVQFGGMRPAHLGEQKRKWGGM